jgi:Na+/melibiose symporter-like transporter
VFFINVPIGLAVLAGSRTLIEAELSQGRLDVVGALTSIGGMMSLVYAITRGGEHGWTDGVTLGAFATAAILLPTFVATQARRAHPLLPLRLFKNRNRAGSYLSMLLLAVGPMGALYLLTLYMQHLLGYSPIQTGLAWLPFGIGIVLGAGITSKLVTRFAPRLVAAPGMLIAAGALAWLSTIGQQAHYVGHVMPAIFATAFGFAMGVVPLTLTAVSEVRPQDAGIASALLNASQQIGVAFGLAVLSTVSVSATFRRMPDALQALYQGRAAENGELVRSAGDALIHGYSTALVTGAVVLALAAVIAATFISAKPVQGHEDGGTAIL